jgi:hypothetical protein
MTVQDFSTRLVVDRTPEQVFEAICNVRGWWSENIDGPTHELGAMFDYRYRDVHHCKLKIVELLAPHKVVWQVLDNYFSFTRDKTEWTGTIVRFDIGRRPKCASPMSASRRFTSAMASAAMAGAPTSTAAFTT